MRSSRPSLTDGRRGLNDDLGRHRSHLLCAGRTAYRAMRLPTARGPHEGAVLQMRRNRINKFEEEELN